MWSILNSLKGLTKHQEYTADNHIFRLHYRFTVGVLAVFSIVLTSYQFFGDPISCTSTGNNVANGRIVETFCWADSTYSSKEAFDKPRHKDGVMYPGVDRVKSEDDIIYHKYYQWVCFILALQALLFYVPRYIWKALEGEQVKNLTMGLNKPVLFPEEVHQKKDALVRYLKVHRGLHRKYTFSYVFCEVLNLVNVVGQVYLLDVFLGGEFTKFGMKVIQHTYEQNTDKTDPMIRLFPRLTKCTFLLGGDSGDNKNLEIFCVLPLNIINEKIFIFLWFWFIILIVLTSLSLAYRIVVFQCSTIRTALLKTKCPVADGHDVQNVTSRLSLGDWFIVYQLAKNVQQIHMGEILHNLAEDLDREERTWTSKRHHSKEGYAQSQEDLV